MWQWILSFFLQLWLYLGKDQNICLLNVQEQVMACSLAEHMHSNKGCCMLIDAITGVLVIIGTHNREIESRLMLAILASHSWKWGTTITGKDWICGVSRAGSAKDERSQTGRGHHHNTVTTYQACGWCQVSGQCICAAFRVPLLPVAAPVSLSPFWNCSWLMAEYCAWNALAFCPTSPLCTSSI